MSSPSPPNIPLPLSSPPPYPPNIPLPSSSPPPHGTSIPLPSSSPSASLPSSPPAATPALPRRVQTISTDPPTTPRTSPRPLPPAYVPLPPSSSPSEDAYSPQQAPAPAQRPTYHVTPSSPPHGHSPSQQSPLPESQHNEPQPFSPAWLHTHLFAPPAEYSLGYIRRTLLLNARNGRQMERMAGELAEACWVVGVRLKGEGAREGKEVGGRDGRERAMRRCEEVAMMALGVGRVVGVGESLAEVIDDEETWRPGMGRHVPAGPVAPASDRRQRFPRFSAERAEAMFGPALPARGGRSWVQGLDEEGLEGKVAVPASPSRSRSRIRTRTRTTGDEGEAPRTPERSIGEAPRTPERPIGEREV